MAWIDTIDNDFGHWLAGFTDGEGCFTAVFIRQCLYAQFRIHCRADDKILRHIHKILNIGNLYFYKTDNQVNPMLSLCVGSLKDCQKIITLFDKYPLRAKKARDFEIWKEIINEQVKNGTRSTPRLCALKQALSDIKKYDVPDMKTVESPCKQLEPNLTYRES